MSVSFQRQMEIIAARYTNRVKTLAKRVDAHVGRSIIYGSEVTGAPGQPKQSGDLIESWKHERVDAYANRWISRSPYAHVIEYNLRGAQLRSSVGGFHSVTMTRHGFKHIVAYELDKLKEPPLRFSAR